MYLLIYFIKLHYYQSKYSIILKQLNTHQEIIRLYTEEISKVSERDGGVRLKLEFGVVMGGGVVRTFVREVCRFHRHEVLHEKVALRLRG